MFQNFSFTIFQGYNKMLELSTFVENIRKVRVFIFVVKEKRDQTSKEILFFFRECIFSIRLILFSLYLYFIIDNS
ncbi:hypothetical protein CISIN_1g035075mg [Citrus sinensis]|uniref:Uncharacterized protein n=1 Tax=Citrus sinensis TaxID=2711 RepID=A0A067EKS3_CITSI|nr:hypothetical protein CISIN_1g035075mg [Citrus sinensis]